MIRRQGAASPAGMPPTGFGPGTTTQTWRGSACGFPGDRVSGPLGHEDVQPKDPVLGAMFCPPGQGAGRGFPSRASSRLSSWEGETVDLQQSSFLFSACTTEDIYRKNDPKRRRDRLVPTFFARLRTADHRRFKPSMHRSRMTPCRPPVRTAAASDCTTAGVP